MAYDALPQAKIFAVVLAAGESHRFGSSKQLASYRGEKLVRRTSRLARDCCGDNTLIVVGHQASEVYRAADRQCRFLLVNEHYENGIGSSIALAATALSHVADALLLLLADQPLITADYLHELMTAWSGTDNNFVATKFDDVQGPPVLMPAASFALLQTLTGDQGAKRLLTDERFIVTTLPFDDARIDIDTPKDLELLRQLAE